MLVGSNWSRRSSLTTRGRFLGGKPCESQSREADEENGSALHVGNPSFFDEINHEFGTPSGSGGRVTPGPIV